MSLTGGARLGAYEITGPLGAGGMGEVYRARDGRLGRDVAIKVLPEIFLVDPDRLARFEREAKTLAALNHPHIAQIYGLEELAPARPGSTTPSGRALVMELVEGRTLDELIASPARLPLADAIDIARQIADALECAHERGIVHRDLKPANVKVRDDGMVKVLDFGLAKEAGVDPASGAALNSPTFTTPAMTERGLILGTAAYMAPEQARGRPVDKRADIWSFGVVFFEMLTGRQLFAGDTVSDTLAAVLRQDVPWRDLPAETPAAVRRVLERCLERDSKRRLRDIGDARLDLEGALAGPAAAEPPVRAPAPRRSAVAAWLPWAVAALAIAAAAAIWMAACRRAPEEPRWAQFTAITDMAGEENSPTLSPDGLAVAYASRTLGTWDIYSQRTGGRNPVVVAGDSTRDESGPAFSPDGQSIAFHESDADGGVFVAGATGESARRVTDFGFHAAWSPDGKQIVFNTEEITRPHYRVGTSELWIVDATGGTPRKIDNGDAVQPSWSPSGARIAFWSNVGGRRDLYTIPAAGGARVAVMEDAPLDWCPVWSPDGRYLYFASDRGGSMNLWRIEIDQSSGRVAGAPEPVTTGVQASAELPSLSKDGARLVFRSRIASVNPIAIPFDPVARNAGVPRILNNANTTLIPSDISRDGKWLALFNIGEQREDIFVGAADGTLIRRLTDDATRDRGPVWTPDGAILFYSNRDGRWQIWTIGADGGGLRKIASPPDDVVYPVPSPEGDRVVFTGVTSATYVASLAPGVPPDTNFRTLEGMSVDTHPLWPTAWSADGEKLAGIIAAANGSPLGLGVYDFKTGLARQVSADKTAFVRWLPDSRHLAYFPDAQHLALLDVVTGAREIVAVRLPLASVQDEFAVALDGRTIYYGGSRAEADIWMVERRKQ